MKRRMLGWVALVTALLLVVTACGDSGEGNGSDDGDDTSVTSTTSGGGGGDDGDGRDTLGTVGTIGNIPGISGECEAVAEVFLGVSQLLIGGRGAAGELFASAADRVPSDLRDDIGIIAKAAEEYADLLAEFDIDLLADPTAFAQLTPEQQQQFAAASEVFSNPEVDEAFANLEAWGEQECGDFDLTE